MRASLAVVALGAIALGCSSSNNATGPDPRNCTKGSIAFPSTTTAKMDASACTVWDYWYIGDSTNYWSYDVHLDSGGAYMFNLAASNDTAHWDAVMELVGTDPNTGQEELLNISDDEGVRWGSQMYVIAPQSGTYSLRAMNYSYGDTATYALKVQTCARLPMVTDSVIGSAQSIVSTDCWLESPLFTFDSVQVKLAAIWMPPGHVKHITVTSGAMEPGFQVFGPGFGVYCYWGLSGCGGGVAFSADDDVVGGGQVTHIGGPAQGTLGGTVSLNIDSQGGEFCCPFQTLDWAGQYTIAIGPGLTSGSGAFTFTVQDITGAADRARTVRQSVPSLHELRLENLPKKPRRVLPPAFLRKAAGH
jgi:hypothetical protein